uniref:CSON005255 protein n=1 Tax=Culicoides sonorensis TaxID=179676 RepID=A0A336K281_CULSO
MAPSVVIMAQEHMSEPVSRTYQYRKVMKPMLERKRRARINRCLDELKELMTGALQNNDGENVTKLEKADILELTVRYLHGLKRKNRLYAVGNVDYTDRFKAGFKHCAIEVSQFLNKIDQNANVHLMRHLSDCIQRVDILSPSQIHMNRVASPNISDTQTIPFPTVETKNNLNALKGDTSFNLDNSLHQKISSSKMENVIPERAMYKINNYVPDYRPVLIVNKGSYSTKEESHSGDVWRPW